MEIVETKAQVALDMISGHLLDPCWRIKYRGLTPEQQNTLAVNKIYRDFPRGFKTLPWIIKNTIREIVRKW